jgi:cyclic pyranopterin phosphate synthase
MADVKQFSGDKILGHSERIKEFFGKGDSKPITVEFDMTNLCNHNCPFCFGYFKRQEHKNSLTKEEAFDYLRQLKQAGALAITFTGGGDPLVNKNTIDAMEYAKHLGMDIALITNGLALEKEISERALKICTWIRVSVDAENAETYSKTHGMGIKAWEKMLDNVKKLVEIKKKNKYNCTIGVGYLTTDETSDKDKMLAFVKLFKKIGVDYSQFRPVMPRWDEEKNVSPDLSSDIIEECVKESTKDYDVLYSKPKYDLMDKPKSEWRPYGICLGVNFTIVISADKKVYVCCLHRGIEKYCLGDLSKESFAEIWEKRQKTFDKINFKDCPYFCRNNPFNIILWEIKTGKRKIEKLKEKRMHENFL